MICEPAQSIANSCVCLVQDGREGDGVSTGRQKPLLRGHLELIESSMLFTDSAAEH